MTGAVLEIPSPQDPSGPIVPDTPTQPAVPDPGPAVPDMPDGPSAPEPDDPLPPDPDGPSVPSPDENLTMHWGSGNRQLIVWIDRPSLEGHLSTMLGSPLKRPLRFDLGMDMTQSAVRSWLNVVELLRSEVDCGGRIPEEPLAMTELQRQFNDLMGVTGEEKIQMAVRLGKGPTPYYSYRRNEESLVAANK